MKKPNVYIPYSFALRVVHAIRLFPRVGHGSVSYTDKCKSCVSYTDLCGTYYAEGVGGWVPKVGTPMGVDGYDPCVHNTNAGLFLTFFCLPHGRGMPHFLLLGTFV